MKDKKALVEPENKLLYIRQQTELLALHRSSYYYQTVIDGERNLHLMKMIDEEYTRHPFYGSRRMTEWLKRKGHLKGLEDVEEF